MLLVDGQMTSPLTVQQTLLHTSSPASERCLEVILRRDYQRYLAYYFSLRHYSREIPPSQYDLMRCFTATSWQRMSEFFQRQVRQTLQQHTPSSSISSSGSLIPPNPSSLLSPKQLHRELAVRRRSALPPLLLLPEGKSCSMDKEDDSEYVSSFLLAHLKQRIHYLVLTSSNSSSSSSSSPSSVSSLWSFDFTGGDDSKVGWWRVTLSRWIEEVLSMLFEEVFSTSFLTSGNSSCLLGRMMLTIAVAQLFLKEEKEKGEELVTKKNSLVNSYPSELMPRMIE